MEDVSPRAIQKFEHELNERLAGIFSEDQASLIRDIIKLELMKIESDRFKELRE
ncbi:MAG TPA: hypothetical protein VES70_08300 [Pseudomonas sp.]|nr:hypothetical protein [Pseudomonas sp.]